jgi:hypothetical protein
MNFSFKCMSCDMSTFSVDSEVLLYGGVPFAAFVCPKCNEYNCVQAGPNGGLVVTAGLPAKGEI